MINRRWMTFWRLLKTGKIEELSIRIFRLIKRSINRKPEVNYSKWRSKWVELDKEEKKQIGYFGTILLLKLIHLIVFGNLNP